MATRITCTKIYKIIAQKKPNGNVITNKIQVMERLASLYANFTKLNCRLNQTIVGTWVDEAGK